MPYVLAVEQVENFFVLRNRFLRIPLEAFHREFIAGPEWIIIHRLQDAQEFGLPLLALIEEFHVITA
ncbi:MAG TPA: hypothetical protein VEK14_08695 [Rhodomicrobium sp.]|nr:hypothetical protein [Rhodomicrobium sp.]